MIVLPKHTWFVRQKDSVCTFESNILGLPGMNYRLSEAQNEISNSLQEVSLHELHSTLHSLRETIKV